MGYRYVVIGSGRQGTAAGYDMAKFGKAERVLFADADVDRAKAAAERVNSLLGTDVADIAQVDAKDREAVVNCIRGYDSMLSAVPYFLNLELTRAAIDARVNMCDLGGNTDIVRQQHSLDAEAKAAGVRIVPDCGMGPGMTISLAVYAMSLLDKPQDVHIYDGGLPQEPLPPWNYQLTFNIEGLTNEYHGSPTFIRKGKLVQVKCLSDFEIIDFPRLGKLEAAVTAGGISTMPWSFKGRLRTLENKTVRYPGHWAQMKAFSDLGLFSLSPVNVDGQKVVPRHVFHALFEPQVTGKTIKDVCVMRIIAKGLKKRRKATATVNLVDYYDPKTKFTSMERLTGWHAAIVAEMMAFGEIPSGAIPLELAVPGDKFVGYAKQRGFNLRTSLKYK